MDFKIDLTKSDITSINEGFKELGLNPDVAGIIKDYTYMTGKVFTTLDSFIVVSYTGSIAIYGPFSNEYKEYNGHLIDVCIYYHNVILIYEDIIMYYNTCSDDNRTENRKLIILPLHVKPKEIHFRESQLAILATNGEVYVSSLGFYIKQYYPSLHLENVIRMSATKSAFAAILDNGTIVTWGDPNNGGVYPETKNNRIAVELYSTSEAFTVRFSDNSLLSWGNSECGGDISKVPLDLVDKIETIYENPSQFQACLSTKGIVSWGIDIFMNDCDVKEPEIEQRVKKLYFGDFTTVALLEDNTIKVWGNSAKGAESDAEELKYVEKVYTTGVAFAALTFENTLFIWGEDFSDNILYRDVEKVFNNHHVFIMIKTNGDIIAVGDIRYGSDVLHLVGYSQQINTIYSVATGFLTILEESQLVITWGDLT